MISPQDEVTIEALIQEVQSALKAGDSERLNTALARFGALHLEQRPGERMTPGDESARPIEPLSASSAP